MIYNYGYLPILDKKYGYEHEIFTKKITGNQLDVNDSNKYITLNKLSLICTSGQTDINQTKMAELATFIHDKQWFDSI